VVGALGALGFAGHALWLHVTTAPELAIEVVVVEGNRRASTESLLRYAGVERGENVLTVDVEAAARAVEGHPWVASAEVSRRFPRTVAIRVVEHEPVVLVALEHLYYANAAGQIVKRLAPGENERLPVITGLSREDVESGAPEAERRLREAIAFVRMVAAMGAEGPALAEVHMDPAVGLSFVAEGSPTRVVLGAAPFEERLQRVREVQRALDAKGLQASRIMASAGRRKDRVVARLLPQTDGEGAGASKARVERPAADRKDERGAPAQTDER
jgi:cell division protein FtsQ